MSLYRPKNSPFWHYDFRRGGHRFFGSTRERSKRAAAEVERKEQKKAAERVAALAAARNGPLTLTFDLAAGRYWSEAGQFKRNTADLKRDIARLIGYFDPDRLLADIDDNEVAKLVAWRRGQRRKLAGRAPLIAPATVNRSTTQVLQRIFTRARRVWRVALPYEPQWRQHMLREPEERVRELRQDEDAALAAVLDPDYEVLRAFSIASGLRMKETLLKWSQVDFAAGVVITVGKGGKPIRMPMTTTMRRLLSSRLGHHGAMVFTYRAKRTRDGRCRGERWPITIQGLKAHWRRCRKKAGVADYRWHDNRHSFATGLLRATGNLKLVQNALHHARIETTTKYTHVLDDELRAGMEKADWVRDMKHKKIN